MFWYKKQGVLLNGAYKTFSVQMRLDSNNVVVLPDDDNVLPKRAGVKTGIKVLYVIQCTTCGFE
jgi:hypothetical protein